MLRASQWENSPMGSFNNLLKDLSHNYKKNPNNNNNSPSLKIALGRFRIRKGSKKLLTKSFFFGTAALYLFEWLFVRLIGKTQFEMDEEYLFGEKRRKAKADGFFSAQGKVSRWLRETFKMIKDLVKAERDKQYTPMRSSKHSFIMASEWI